MHSLIRPSLILLAGTTVLSAAAYFTEDFNGGAVGRNMALGTGFGNPTTTFADKRFTITSGDKSRIYLGTNDADYSTVNFVFQATVTVPAGKSPWAMAFIGMGNRNAATINPGEPVLDSCLCMIVRNDLNQLLIRDIPTPGQVSAAVAKVPVVASGTHLLRMTWNATTKSALFEFDAGNNGSIDGSFTVNGADNGFTGENSQLVLGGGAGLSFDNISISG